MSENTFGPPERDSLSETCYVPVGEATTGLRGSKQLSQATRPDGLLVVLRIASIFDHVSWNRQMVYRRFARARSVSPFNELAVPELERQ